ncbi:MAG: hypothetical protein ACRDMH_15890 [Solirubrobacterales bacterium]
MRRAITIGIAATAAVLSIALADGGHAGASVGQTLTFFGDASHESDTLIDNPPKSPSPNPGSRRFRLSVGDQLVVRTPLLDHRGGTRIGTLYAEGAIVNGNRFANAVIHVDGVAKFGDDQLTIDGIIRDQKLNTVAVTGGTGAYEGARGSVTEMDVSGGQGSKDTVHLLP